MTEEREMTALDAKRFKGGHFLIIISLNIFN